jgi:hypothetical protein
MSENKLPDIIYRSVIDPNYPIDSNTLALQNSVNKLIDQNKTLIEQNKILIDQNKILIEKVDELIKKANKL